MPRSVNVNVAVNVNDAAITANPYGPSPCPSPSGPVAFAAENESHSRMILRAARRLLIWSSVVTTIAATGTAGAPARPQGIGPSDGYGVVGITGPGRIDNRLTGRVDVAISRAAGGIDRATALMVLRRRLAMIRRCYERGLATNPSLQGRLVVQLSIDPTGRPLTADVVTSFLQPSEVQPCTAAMLRRVIFPSFTAAEPATLTLQIQFSQVIRPTTPMRTPRGRVPGGLKLPGA